MKQIEVDLDVFSAIWAMRLPQESSENDVLRRILLDRDSAESPVSEGSPSQIDSELLKVQKEVKTSNFQAQPRTEDKRTMGKIRWVDDIEAELRALGGQASLHSIYKAVKKRRVEGNRSVPATFEAVIRRTLEDHSSDSANFRGQDIFALVGRGEWALR